MRKTGNSKKEKKKLLILGLVLLTIGLGLGYALLSEQLKLNGSVNYGAMSWNVGFDSTIDGGGSVTSTSTISADKKTITITCDIGTSTMSETCIAKATIKNGSTFAVELKEAPTITFDNTYINSVDVTWIGNSSNIELGDSIGTGLSEELQIKITTKALSKDMLPEGTLSIPVTLTMNWGEADTSGN